MSNIENYRSDTRKMRSSENDKIKFALPPSQTQTFFALRTVFANINQTFIEDLYAVF